MGKPLPGTVQRRLLRCAYFNQLLYSQEILANIAESLSVCCVYAVPACLCLIVLPGVLTVLLLCSYACSPEVPTLQAVCAIILNAFHKFDDGH